MEMLIVVMGKPIPLKRPRKSGNKFYDSQVKLKEDFIWKAKSQIPSSFCPFISPLELYLEFYMPIPSSWSKKKQLKVSGNSHSKKPDLSNLIKFVEDALNKVIWEDDSYISKIHAKKMYSPEPKTVIDVKKTF